MEDYKKLELSWRIADFLPVSEKLGTITEYIIPEMDADMDAVSGSVLKVILDDQEIYGIAAMDGAIIYQGDEGYIIVSYLDMMEAERIYVAGTEVEDAA